MVFGGSGGIRTHGTVPRTLVFKTRALNHSATLPYRSGNRQPGDARASTARFARPAARCKHIPFSASSTGTSCTATAAGTGADRQGKPTAPGTDVSIRRGRRGARLRGLDSFLLGFPVPREQFRKARHGDVGQARQDVCHPCLRLDVVHLATSLPHLTQDSH